MDPTTPSVEGHSTVTAQPHAQTAEIVRQVEFYFSDENLPHDAHMLGLTGGNGNGAVSFGHIHCFKKMRKYKPRARVIASLKQSTELEVIENRYIKRRRPLRLPLLVVPKIEETRTNKELSAKPWLTKGMLKPTGFEADATEGPIRPEEYEMERKLYHPDEAFAIRIEHAVTRYCARRKMHQLTRQIFSKFLIFGGFDGTQRQFTGGLSGKELEDCDKEQIEAMKANFTVSEMVFSGLDEDQEGGATWTVEFETVAKAFLSSQFLQYFDWYDGQTCAQCVNILRNFYNYLLYHDVCPEYVDQLHAARKVCDAAESELPMLVLIDRRMPGDFNKACSTLYGGSFAGAYIDLSQEWALQEDNANLLSDEQALQVVVAALVAHGSNDQLLKAEERAGQSHQWFNIVSLASIGLEVLRVEHASPEVVDLYAGDESLLKDTFIRTTGKLHCNRWKIPHAAPIDAPQAVLAKLEDFEDESFEFIVEEDILQYCYPGLKIDAVVKQFDVGISFIDSVEAVYPSFFTWTMNEVIRDWKEPGPPKDWMARQTDRRESSQAHKNEAVAPPQEIEGSEPIKN